MAIDPFSSLQRSVFTNGSGHSYYAETAGLPLSLKSVSNGRALYRFDRKEVAVDDGGYLILNEGQPYSIEIASPTRVETFVLWFPESWAGQVEYALNRSAERLLEFSPNDGTRGVTFFDEYVRHDDGVTPGLETLRTALKSRELMDDGWVEEKLRELLRFMLIGKANIRDQIKTLSATRQSTRVELWRRINRARDYLHANLKSPPSLSDLGRIACLSPFHLLRIFKDALGVTPHQYLTRARIERARFLLEKTYLPITAICLECGFTSLGSFSSLFHKHCGVSPRQWRNHFAAVPDENSNIKEVYLDGAT